MQIILGLMVHSVELAQATQTAARRRIIERGIVQFRADEEIMDLLLKVAAYKRLPYGVMCRTWIVEKLRQESKALA